MKSLVKYEDIQIQNVPRVNPTVHIFANTTNWDFIPNGFKANGTKAKGMWYNDSKKSMRERKEEKSDFVYFSRLSMGFDIETTNHLHKEPNGKEYHVGYMYIWQFAIGEHVVLGRTWSEFRQLLEIIASRLQNGYRMENGKLVHYLARIWVANLSFEFQFARKYLDITDMFAKEERQPLTVETEDSFFFQDALAITNSGLADIPKLYNLPTPKLVGDLDYNVPRNSYTQLDQTELGYCINDVVILAEFNNWLMTNYIDNGLPIPLTKTGILRDSVVKNAKKFLKGNCKKGYVKARVAHLASLFPENYEEFNTISSYLFRGGYTHGNKDYAGVTVNNVNGWDFTSSYPAVMLQCKFPMTKFQPCDPKTVDEIIAAANTPGPGGAPQAHWGRFCFKNLRNKTPHSLESASKTLEYHHVGKSLKRFRELTGAVVDNGRILSADIMTVYLTDVDLKAYKLMYDWDEVLVRELHVAAVAPLPKYLTAVIQHYYALKNGLKKQGLDGTTEYCIAKAMVNAGYGMMCEHAHLESIYYAADEWGTDAPEKGDIQSLNELYLKDTFGEDPAKVICGDRLPRKFLSPYWGIYVTAFARLRLLKNLVKMGDDGMYCDTDSIYANHPDDHKTDIDAWNRAIYATNDAWVAEHNKLIGFDPVYYQQLANDPDPDKQMAAHQYRYTCDKVFGFCEGLLPEDFRDLGEFDLICKESEIFKFKHLGAKRYLKTYTKKGKVVTDQTVAGLPKGTLVKAAGNQDPYEFFTDKMTISNCKNGHCYVDFAHSDYITDNQGNTERMEEQSSVGIFPIDFSMTLEGEFAHQIFAAAAMKARKEYI